MTRPALPVGLSIVAAMLAFGSFTTAAGPLQAKADISGEGIKGKVEFKEVPAQSSGHMDMTFLTGTMAVEISVSVSGLKPGAHGIHLHAVGKCESPFTSAGGHFDPGPAGNMDPDANHPFHMGDLPNLVADATGKATLKTVTNRVTLREGPLSVFDSDGTAVIIHANPDEGITAESKAGKSGGPRLACGVVEKD